jgi:phage tail P2-like protein
MSYPTVLPPASTPLEKALEQTAARVLDMATPVRDVWSPWNCPAGLLPWLAWGVAITHWQTTWAVERKREAVADAIPYHRRKGTRSSVAEVLAWHHPAFQVVEWFEANPPREPHTFEVRAPADVIPPSFLTVEKADAIIADVAAAKPLRSHFDFVQTFDLRARLFMAAGAMTGAVSRHDYTTVHDSSRDWSLALQTEDGEPIFQPDGIDLLETA